ncbi:MAG: Glu-tRNA(Gln) amidotransferase subunit GatE, partial [Nanoarchaeota archaeon]
KTVVDGSNTSGFQRTALIARGGTIKTSEGEVRISNISLEEEACKNIQESPEEDKAGLKVWRLDRLGIPLIEIGTEPDIKSPLQCQEASKKIGILLRSLLGVKRGLGTIRQDVNISIAGGDRIEVKGFQELALIPTLVELEVQRQQNLIAIHELLKKNKNLKAEEIIELNNVFSKSESKLIKSVLEKKGKIFGVKLGGFAGILGKELQPKRRYGTEMYDHAKIYGVGGMIHSDEDLSKYKFSEAEIREIKQKLNVQASDAFIIIADQEEKARKGIQAALQRAELQFKVAVPREVRKANPDATTSYMRPLPGAARMYPETDVPLIRPDLKNIQIPETLEEKFLRYQKQLGLSKDLAWGILAVDAS